jgi:peptide deformylase
METTTVDDPTVPEALATVIRAPDQPVLDHDQRLRRSLALQSIRQVGDPVLRAVARPITQFDHMLEQEITQMTTILVNADGAGLAAPQIGTLQRLFLYRTWNATTGTSSPIETIINPQRLALSEELVSAPEGCLSFPGIHLLVERPSWIEFRFQDATGAIYERRAEGFEARVIQHEWDHLDGILILQRVDNHARRQAMQLWRTLGGQR